MLERRDCVLRGKVVGAYSGRCAVSWLRWMMLVLQVEQDLAVVRSFGGTGEMFRRFEVCLVEVQ